MLWSTKKEKENLPFYENFDVYALCIFSDFSSAWLFPFVFNFFPFTSLFVMFQLWKIDVALAEDWNRWVACIFIRKFDLWFLLFIIQSFCAYGARIFRHNYSLTSVLVKRKISSSLFCWHFRSNWKEGGYCIIFYDKRTPFSFSFLPYAESVSIYLILSVMIERKKVRRQEYVVTYYCLEDLVQRGFLWKNYHAVFGLSKCF